MEAVEGRVPILSLRYVSRDDTVSGYNYADNTAGKRDVCVSAQSTWDVVHQHLRCDGCKEGRGGGRGRAEKKCGEVKKIEWETKSMEAKRGKVDV